MHDPASEVKSRFLTRVSITFATGLMGVGLFAGCQKAAPAPVAPKPPEVVVQYPKSEDVQEFEETTGRLVSRAAVDVRARVSGYLEKAYFADGAMVQEGQLLFQIDPRPYEAEMIRAKANVDQTRARLDRLKRDEERKRKLFRTNNTTQEEIDLTVADRAEAEAGLEAQMAMLDIAKLNLEFTRITSPITGRISRRLVDPGNLVKADDTPLVTVMSLNPIYAYFDIDERTVLKFERLIREGKVQSPRDARYEVAFSLADEADFSRKGVIDFLDNHISNTTGTLRLRATVENTDLLLSPGMFIRLHVPIGTPHPALMIPEEALSSDQGQRFVFVLNEKDEAIYRRVKIGLLQSGYRVIEEGLTSSDRVIVSGLQRVRVGKPVTPKTAEVKPVEKSEVPKPEPPADSPKSTEPKTTIEAKGTAGQVARP